MTDPTVLLIGATGALGGLIARQLADRGARLRLLVRPESRDKLPQWLRAEAESIVADEPGIFDGVHAVVSAVQGETAVLVDDQLRWLRAARDAGVHRFIPSDYTVNFFGLADGDSIHSDYRREFARRAEDERGAVEVVHLFNGGFLDTVVFFGFIKGVDLERREAHLWGDGSAAMEFTTFADTAAYTAAVALDERPVGSTVYVAGSQLDFRALVGELEAGLGSPLTVVDHGSIDDLSAEIDRRTAVAETRMTAVPLMYWRAMLSGKGGAPRLDNARYPQVVPQTVREYARQIADGTAVSGYGG